MSIRNIPPITVQTMNMKLLEKVEELTLYLIEQNKQIQLLKVDVDNHKNEIIALTLKRKKR